MAMKKLFVILLVIGVVFLGVIGLAVMNINSIAKFIRPQLETTLSSVLKVPVTIKSLEASLFPTTRLKASGVTLGGAKSLNVGTVEFVTSLLPLLKKRVEISKVIIDSPQIVFVKSADGTTTIKEAPQKDSAAPAGASSQPENKSSTAPILINLEHFEIKNGSFRVEDPENTPPAITNLSVSAAVKLEGDSAVISAIKTSADIEGVAKVSLTAPDAIIGMSRKTVDIKEFVFSLGNDPLTGSLTFDGASFSGNIALSADNFVITALSAALVHYPKYKDFKFAGAVSPNLKITIHSPAKINVSDKGTPLLSDLSGKAILDIEKEQSLTAKIALTGVGLTSGANIVNNLSGNLTVGLAGSDATFATKDLSLHYNGALETTVSNVTASIAAPLGANMLAEAKGTFSSHLTNTTIKGFNLAKEVLRKVNSIPFLAGSLLEVAPPEYQAALSGTSTNIKDIAADGALGSGTAALNKFSVASDLFSMAGGGTVDLQSKELNLNSTIIFPASFSAAIADRVRQLRAVLEADGTLALPLDISGVPPKVLVLPNVEKLLKKGAGNILRNRAEDLLDKALEKKGGPGGKAGKDLLKGLLGF
jgi:uncharacterized protein involved in outer membrane biogenesis